MDTSLSQLTLHGKELESSSEVSEGRVRRGDAAWGGGFHDLVMADEDTGSEQWYSPQFSRRRFIQIMGASVALARLTQCTRQPEEEIVPYVDQPEHLIPGKVVSYASATSFMGYGRGVLVTTHEGRPTKVEGNPDHPASRGATSVFDQASVLDLYDPDRSQAVMERGDIRSWQSFEKDWQQEIDPTGKGLGIVTGNFTSPTLLAQMRGFLGRYPDARWYVYEPIMRSMPKQSVPVYDLDKATTIVCLDADVLYGDADSVRHSLDFAEGRRVRSGQDGMNRLYVAEPVPTVTGAKADHRLAVRGSRICELAGMLAARLGVGVAVRSTATGERMWRDWLDAVVDELARNRGRCVVIAGMSQDATVHSVVRRLNDHLGNVGRTVRYVEPFDAAGQAESEGIETLLGEAGSLDAVLMMDCDPVYTMPADAHFEASLKRVRYRVHHGLHVNDTALLSHWHLPASHEMEMWSDIRSAEGNTTVIQPLIEPLYDTRSWHEVMAMLMGERRKKGYDIIRGAWRERMAGNVDDFELWWRRTLHDGLVHGGDRLVDAAQEYIGTDTLEIGKGGAPGQSLEMCIRPDPCIWDGRHVNNPWLQELPKPISKLTWDNAALMNPRTARNHALSNGDVVQLDVGDAMVEVPVWIVPGIADDVIGIHLGYGQAHAGRVGGGMGFDGYQLRSMTALHFRDAKLTKTGRTYMLVSTQQHQRMEGRELLRTATLEGFRKDPRATAGPSPNNPEGTLMPAHDYSEGYKWGMAIDLTSCIGCGVCTIACQAENNIPSVGKEEVGAGREMHWIRIDRYYEGEDSDVGIHHQPIPCMHCEHAPCELVCPTGATQHSSEGLNEMVYNRCIGTRYCSNNCPYKVRRFNFFDYVEAETQAPVRSMNRNPNVTVRSRGIMEKCTYCVQRIEAARINAMKDMRRIGSNEVVPACAGACPTRAIVFGDLNDPESDVSRMHGQPHQYGMLTELNTYPRTRYLTEIRNPHPEWGRMAGDQSG